MNFWFMLIHCSLLSTFSATTLYYDYIIIMYWAYEIWSSEHGVIIASVMYVSPNRKPIRTKEFYKRGYACRLWWLAGDSQSTMKTCLSGRWLVPVTKHSCAFIGIQGVRVTYAIPFLCVRLLLSIEGVWIRRSPLRLHPAFLVITKSCHAACKWIHPCLRHTHSRHAYLYYFSSPSFDYEAVFNTIYRECTRKREWVQLSMTPGIIGLTSHCGLPAFGTPATGSVVVIFNQANYILSFIIHVFSDVQCLSNFNLCLWLCLN